MPLQQRFGDAGLAVREHGAARPGKDLDLLGEEGGEVGESGAGGGEVGEQARHQLEVLPALRLTYMGVMLTVQILISRFREKKVLRIRDVHPRSRILIFTHPGSKNNNKREG